MKNRIREELLHYIWELKYFDQSQLKTEDGQELTILNAGEYNRDAGPDFLNARIALDDIVWAGHIEIHVSASDWYNHGHDSDEKYQNVILHVVYHSDSSVRLQDRSKIPCLVIYPRVNQKIIANYNYLNEKRQWVPCAEALPTVDAMIKTAAVTRAMTSRLTRKSKALEKEYTELNLSLNELIYRQLGQAFGLRINGPAMKRLTELTDYTIVCRIQDQIILLEALFLGQSGLLPKKSNDRTVNRWIAEYAILQSKYSLTPLKSTYWKYARLRPPDFPCLRITQFAHFLYNAPNLTTFVTSMTFEEMKYALSIELSGYWKHHYRFETRSNARKKALGEFKQRTIFVNAIIPILFFLSKIEKSNLLYLRAVQLLETLKPEHNRVTNRWVELGMVNKTSADSQGLIELKQFYCDHFKCMSCQIGHKILNA